MAEKSSVTSDNNSTTKSPHLAFTTISNIKLHIPVQLSISEPNYKKWSRLFRLLVLCFNLMRFLDGTTVASSSDDVEWYQFDALLQGWILSTVSDEVSDLVLASNPSAHALWKAIYKLFHDNKHARAMQLELRFRTTIKGNWSINEYCHLLENLADYLDDVDAPVTEHALVLQVFQGLPKTSGPRCIFCNIKTRSRHSWRFDRHFFWWNNNKPTPSPAPAHQPHSSAPAPEAASWPAVGSSGMQAAAVACRALDGAPLVVKTGAATEAIVDVAITNNNPSAQTLGRQTDGSRDSSIQ
ncbi:unnamed protein product [Cuscuta campestris]|uniref:Retrotransposon Copia-like N-terminal domain-containing protein n=1 Tax=Cuscuta campestris TaxID=132261 RepID=A0A484KXS0_9ASTE|nr:unnamed protein product [Cuscuta campestris]